MAGDRASWIEFEPLVLELRGECVEVVLGAMASAVIVGAFEDKIRDEE